MEKLLEELFEFQCFCRNPELQSVIDEVNADYPDEALDEGSLSWISAAGESLPAGKDDGDGWL